MATFTLRKGNHAHTWPPNSTWPWIGAQFMVRLVTFGETCSYDSAPYNADDVNKLFGLSFGLGGVHDNSARFGWRWSNSDQCIELLAYVYRAGARNWDEQLRFPVVAQVKLGQTVRCSILVTNSQTDGPVYAFSVNSNEVNGFVTVPRPTDLPSFGLTSGLYFGGLLTAPHEMKVQIDRI